MERTPYLPRNDRLPLLVHSVSWKATWPSKALNVTPWKLQQLCSQPSTFSKLSCLSLNKIKEATSFLLKSKRLSGITMDFISDLSLCHRQFWWWWLSSWKQQSSFPGCSNYALFIIRSVAVSSRSRYFTIYGLADHRKNFSRGLYIGIHPSVAIDQPGTVRQAWLEFLKCHKHRHYDLL